MLNIRRYGLVGMLALAAVVPAAAQTATQRVVEDRSARPAPPHKGVGILSAVDTETQLTVLPRGPRPVDLLQHRARQEVVPRSRSVDYSGPRFGVTWLPRAAVDSLRNHNIKVGQTITQYGWQMEHEIYVTQDGPRVLNEWVLLAGGLESGVFLPSFTWLVGARDKSGNEIGVGPNGSVAGVGLAAAAGITMHSGGINFPINFAVAKSKTGARYSVLTGFTI